MYTINLYTFIGKRTAHILYEESRVKRSLFVYTYKYMTVLIKITHTKQQTYTRIPTTSRERPDAVNDAGPTSSRRLKRRLDIGSTSLTTSGHSREAAGILVTTEQYN